MSALVGMTSPNAGADAELRRLRGRRIRRTAASGFLAKAAMFLPTLAIAAVAVPVLGAERFGVLMTVLSLLSFLSLADMGIGSSLVTSISRAFGAGRHDQVRRLQANGLVVISVIAVLLMLVGMLVREGDMGSFIFPASPPAVRDEATDALGTFALLFALSLPLTLVGKIQLGMQRGHLANYWQTAAALGNFAAGSLAVVAGKGVPWIIAGMMSGTLVCGLANLALHYRGDPDMRPRLADISRMALLALLKEAGYYFALQIIFTIAYAADTLIVARQLGAGQASTYALSERVFSIVTVAVSVFTVPLWAAYGEALGGSDLAWARRTLIVSTRRIFVWATLLSVGLALAWRPLMDLLSSGHLALPLALAVAMATWRIVEAIGTSLSVYLYAAQKVRFILLVGSATAAISLVGKVLLLPHYGLAIVPLTMLVCYTLFCLLPSVWLVARPDR